MARAKGAGHGRPEEALTRASGIDVQMAEMKRQRIETERRTEDCFQRIIALLLENKRLLQALPDAVCEKIGFKSPGS